MREIASPYEVSPNHLKQAKYHPHTRLRKLFCSTDHRVYTLIHNILRETKWRNNIM